MASSSNSRATRTSSAPRARKNSRTRQPQQRLYVEYAGQVITVDELRGFNPAAARQIERFAVLPAQIAYLGA